MNKNKTFTLIAFTMALFLTFSSALGNYDGTGYARASTDAKIWTDKADYHPAETVTIYGTGFLPNINVALNVTKLKDGTITTLNTKSNSHGNFTTTYQVDKVGAPLYNIKATDGTNDATTTFTDSTPPTLDGHIISAAGKGTSFSVTLTTTNTNDVIYVIFAVAGAPTVGAPAATGLTFYSRGSRTSANGAIYAYYAIAASALTAVTISVTSSTSEYGELMAFGIAGANTASPFDGSAATSTGTSSPASVTFSTSLANEFVIGGLFVYGTANANTITAGNTTIDSVNQNGATKMGGADEYATPTSSGSQTLSYTIAGTWTNDWDMIGDAVKGAVTQPITVTLSGASSRTVTINGGNPSPSTFTADGASHSISMDAGASFTLSFSNSGSVRDGFSVSSAFSATSGSYTASSSAVSVTAYEQVQNTFSASGLTGSASASLTGTYLSIGSSTIVTLTVGTPSASAWSDYNNAVTFPTVATGSGSTERWSMSSAYSTAALTAGGNTYSRTYYHQWTVTPYYTRSDSSSPTVTNVVTYTSFGGALTATPTLGASGGTAFWADASSAVTYTSPIAGGSGERWKVATGDTTTHTAIASVTSSQDATVLYYHQWQVTLQYTIANTAGSGYSDPTATFTQFGGSVTDTAKQSSAPSDWIDAASSVTYTNPLTGSTSSQRWMISGGASPAVITSSVTASGTLNPSYYHQYQVTFAVYPSASGSTTPTGTNWEDAGSLAISASVNSGFTFSIWSSDTGSITFINANSASTTATIGAAGTITANFLGVSLSPTSGHVGYVVTVTGSGFAANSLLTATFDGSSITLSGTHTTDGSGNFPSGMTFVVPESTAGGKTVTMTDASSHSASATFTVTSGFSATVGNSPGSVAATSSTTFTLTVTNTEGTASYIFKVVLVVDTFSSITVTSSPTGWSGVPSGNTITWTVTDAATYATYGIAQSAQNTFGWRATAPASTGTYNHQPTVNAASQSTVPTGVTEAPEFPLGLGLAFTLCAAVYIGMKKKKGVENPSKVN